MNQIGHLQGIKFKELDKNQLIEVISFYTDENKYPFNFNNESRISFTKKDIVLFFESQYYDIHVLKSFYKYWTK